tara:strand:- start:123 stop:407 length:285 start_codon:yes stop_codon:yes gene_type:complete
MARKPREAGTAPAQITYADVMAMKALAAGTANEGQQKRALDWIINQACRRYAWPYEADPRETDINLGRMRVGMSIIDLVEMPGSAMEKLRNENG